jgi:sulfide:quinone oxidoreductase
VTQRRSDARANVLIAGGGFAALEAALALRALAADRVQLTLLAPDPVFRYHPAATVEAFGERAPRLYDLRRIAADLGAGYHAERVQAVYPDQRSVLLGAGARLSYDALILAVGARAATAVPGAVTFHDQRDVPLLRAVLQELDAGAVTRLAFVVPSGPAWPLPVYELALFSAARAARAGVDAEVLLVTPEREPLGIFGTEGSALVAELLDARGVSFVGDSVATGVRRDGALALQFEGALRVDRVVAAPELRARRITGVPASWWGFVPTDTLGRVEGVADAYAAGDMTTFPVKQGGLAAQQADRVAHTIAAGLGATVKELHAAHTLSVRLLGGERPLLLRTELDWQGRPTTATVEHAAASESSGEPKVFGRYLTPYLESLGPVEDSSRAG